MRKHNSLPKIAYLRTARQLPVREVYEALGISRGHAYQLRTRNGFPTAPGRMIDAQRLACWLAHPARGVQVVWV